MDSCFAKGKPLYRVGTPTWIGRAKWSWYIGMFKRIAQGEGMTFALTPVEYLECWERQPRLMAILETIQGRFVFKAAESQEKSMAEAKSSHGKFNRHPRN